jgi:hypothetical protein
MNTANLVRRYRKAMQRIHTPSSCKTDKIKRHYAPRPISPLAEQVRQVASQLYQPGAVASIQEIATQVKADPAYVQTTIGALQRRGLWPYKKDGKRRAAE